LRLLKVAAGRVKVYIVDLVYRLPRKAIRSHQSIVQDLRKFHKMMMKCLSLMKRMRMKMFLQSQSAREAEGDK
jgi:hypothetical protein